MKKNKINMVAKNNIEKSHEYIDDLNKIEQFILGAGSDDLPAFGGKFEGGIHCQQIPDELAACILAILESGESIKSYLEIGVAAGGTAFVINHFFTPDKIVLIDDNKHHKAGLRPEILKEIERKEIIGNSNDPAIFAAAEDLGPFDIILIDSAHDYPTVKADADNYLPMLRDGGFLIMHDSVVTRLGIYRVVGELKQRKDFKFIGEYVTTKHTSSCGIALFKKAII
jgi:cephalosporin hydroxylase